MIEKSSTTLYQDDELREGDKIMPKIIFCGLNAMPPEMMAEATGRIPFSSMLMMTYTPAFFLPCLPT